MPRLLWSAATHAACLQIDMDTIETSNLNRQFLFRKRHVGESKAKVAAEAVKRFRPNASIMAHQVRWRILRGTVTKAEFWCGSCVSET